MGCYHYERAAEAARAKIEELEKERESYIKTQTALSEAARAIRCYVDYLGMVDTAMSSVIVNGEPFDKGQSAVHHDNLYNDTQTLNDIITDTVKALREIASEIQAQETIIDNEYTCGPCSTPPPSTSSKPALQ